MPRRPSPKTPCPGVSELRSIRSEDVARLLAERKPIRVVPDSRYAIELDSDWRDCAGLNGRGPAEPPLRAGSRVNDAINRQSRFTRSMLMAFGLIL